MSGSAVVSVQGVSGIRRALRPLYDPELTAAADAADKRGAQALAKELRAEVRPLSRRMGRAVRVKRARTGKPGWVVGGRRKTAFFWHMVIDGTRDHGPRRAPALAFQVDGKWVRARRVRGVRGSDPIGAVMARSERRVAAQIEQDIAKGAGL